MTTKKDDERSSANEQKKTEKRFGPYALERSPTPEAFAATYEETLATGKKRLDGVSSSTDVDQPKTPRES